MRLFPLCAAAILFPAKLVFGQADVTVVVDMTPEGRLVPHPSAGHPAYYLPVMRGFHDYGRAQVEHDIPTGHDIVHAVAPELAKQGYLATGDANQASLVVDFAWGKIGKTGKGDTRNEIQRDALVLGKTQFDVATPESYGHDEYMAATKERRYFIVITAYDAKAYAKGHKDVILWKARMSMPSAGVNFAGIVPALAKAGGPQFGYETVGHPILVQNPTDQLGRVDVGAVTEKK